MERSASKTKNSWLEIWSLGSKWFWFSVSPKQMLHFTGLLSYSKAICMYFFKRSGLKVCHLAWSYPTISCTSLSELMSHSKWKNIHFSFCGPSNLSRLTFWTKLREKYNVKHLFEKLGFRGKNDFFQVFLKSNWTFKGLFWALSTRK